MAALDHVVIHVGRGGMDDAAAASETLGFTLTPRGYHSMGSINHLIMFGTDYLELLGVPAGDTTSRPELQGAPLGLNGLVFKTADADATFAHLQAVGMAGEPPKSFSRPVGTPDGSQEARFRTVTVRSDVFAAGRVYFCEHNTPELVWRPDLPELTAHANGAQAFKEIIIVSDQPAEEAANFALLLNGTAAGGNTVVVEGFRVVVLSWEGYSGRFGANAVAAGGRKSIFGAVGVASTEVAAGAEPELRVMEGFETLLEFWPHTAAAL